MFRNISVLVVVMFTCVAASMQELQSPLVASNAWVKAPAEGETTAIAFVGLTNGSDHDVYVDAVTTDAAWLVRMQQATAGGEPQVLEEITAPAKRTVTMTAEGLHLALVNLQRPLTAGETVTLTFVTHTGAIVTVPAIVQSERP
jgi:periplasmic copper chaperone A